MKIFGSIFFILTVLCAFVQAGPNNVIFFIGDGMGYEQVHAARCYTGQSLPFEQFPHQAECTTYSANSSVTDSAAVFQTSTQVKKPSFGFIVEDVTHAALLY